MDAQASLIYGIELLADNGRMSGSRLVECGRAYGS